MDVEKILIYGIGLVVSILGFFVRSVWNDVRQNRDDIGTLMGKTDLNRKEIESESKLTDIKLKGMLDKFELKRERDERGRFKKRDEDGG
jgi:hypothetical protein